MNRPLIIGGRNKFCRMGKVVGWAKRSVPIKGFGDYMMGTLRFAHPTWVMCLGLNLWLMNNMAYRHFYQTGACYSFSVVMHLCAGNDEVGI